MLSLHRLRILREIDQRGSVSAAAKALYMTPPSISQHMSQLESETGVVLLERVGRGVRLTPVAKRLVTHTERMLADMERAEAELAVARESVTGPLAIATPSTVGCEIVVPAIAALTAEFPSLEATVSDQEQPDSFVELRSGKLDIAIGLEYTFSPTIETAGFDVELLLAEPIYLAMPATHPLAEGPVSLAELRNERWFAAREPNPCRDAVLRTTAYCGFEPHIALLSTIDYQMTLAAVGAGLGVTLVPHLALQREYPDVVLHPLVDPPLRRRVFAAIREGSRSAPAVAAALEALKHEAERVAAGFREPELMGRD